MCCALEIIKKAHFQGDRKHNSPLSAGHGRYERGNREVELLLHHPAGSVKLAMDFHHQQNIDFVRGKQKAGKLSPTWIYFDLPMQSERKVGVIYSTENLKIKIQKPKLQRKH